MRPKQEDLLKSVPLLGLMMRQQTNQRYGEDLQFCVVKHTDKRRSMGWPMVKIAAELGLSRATLYRWMTKFQGIMIHAPRPRRLSAEKPADGLEPKRQYKTGGSYA